MRNSATQRRSPPVSPRSQKRLVIISRRSRATGRAGEPPLLAILGLSHNHGLTTNRWTWNRLPYWAEGKNQSWVTGVQHAVADDIRGPPEANRDCLSLADTVAKVFLASKRARLIRRRHLRGQEDSETYPRSNKHCATDRSRRLLQQYWHVAETQPRDSNVSS